MKIKLAWLHLVIFYLHEHGMKLPMLQSALQWVDFLRIMLQLPMAGW